MMIENAPLARSDVRALRASSIREVANAGMGRSDVLPFWFGEPDEATPGFVEAAAIAAIGAHQTRYTQTLGTPELREALAAYVTRLHGPMTADRIAVTSGGTPALMIAMQAFVSPGDRVVVLTPMWPNLAGMPRVLGAQVAHLALDFNEGGWQLDTQRLIDALTPGTRALLLNSPNNPTGFTLPRTAQAAILDHCRRHGIWVIGDDVYERIYFEGACAPTFLDIAQPEDRVISCNSFSKAWSMTGWRIGWMVVPRVLLPDVSKLIELNTTCAPPFVQHAALAAVREGEDSIKRSVARLRHGRDHLFQRLQQVRGVQLAAPAAGAMYSFFHVEGMTDSLQFCKRLMVEAGLGLAPGIAFGAEGEGYLRWCFASTIKRLDDGVDRLERFLAGDRTEG